MTKALLQLRSATLTFSCISITLPEEVLNFGLWSFGFVSDFDI